MPKTDTKARILYIYKLLLQETDREHDITIQQIIDKLEEPYEKMYERKHSVSDHEKSEPAEHKPQRKPRM